MASVSISGSELLESLEAQLQHLSECERWLFDFYDDVAVRTHLRTRYGSDAWTLRNVEECEKHIEELRNAPKPPPATRSVTELFLWELPRLQAAAKLVSRMVSCIYGFPEVPREERIRLATEQRQTLEQRLRLLVSFDDDE